MRSCSGVEPHSAALVHPKPAALQKKKKERKGKKEMNGLSGNDMQLSNNQLCVLFWCRLSAGVDPSLQIDNRIQGSSQAALPSSKHNKSRAANTRDERFRSGNLHVRAPLVQPLLHFCLFLKEKVKDCVACF